MSVAEKKNTTPPEALQRVIRIQNLTLIWMSVEAAVALAAAWMARSPALLAFGGDSAIELISALVVRRRFQLPAGHDQAESRAARIAGVLLLALAACVVAESAVTLLGHAEPRPSYRQSYLGIAVLIVAAIFMPWLATEKRRLSAVTGSAALRADAAESALCGYLSVIALVGLAVNAIWHVAWADPVAALCLVPFIVREGWEAVQGEPDGCCP
jgi:divalent metal cation (Fe/Co/Zn/Cd) transporter